MIFLYTVGTSIASTDTPGEPLNSVTNTSPPVSTTLQSTSSVLNRVVSQTFENPGSNVAGRMKNVCTIQ